MFDAGIAPEAGISGEGGIDAEDGDAEAPDAEDGDAEAPDAEAADAEAPDAEAADAEAAEASTGGDAEATELGDAGVCQGDSLARVDGGCHGSYCAMTLAALDEAVSPGACDGAATLSLVCDGQLTRKAAQCAQDNALSFTLESSVRGCMRRDPQLSEVPSGCVDCYAQELLCTLSNCLATCVAGFESACGSCRREQCGAAFARCSGLPTQ